MEIAASSLMGYLVGMINPAYLISKRKGFDIREIGSGNAGASNAIITMGKWVGLIVALFDVFKAYAIIKLSIWLFKSSKIAGAAAGTCCVLGHIFPFYMHFNGGKGLACLGGVILAFDPRLFLILLAVEIVLVLIIQYIFVVPVTGSVAFLIIQKLHGGTWGAFTFYFLIVAAIVWKHLENIRRVKEGTELKVKFLWNQEKEIERLKRNGAKGKLRPESEEE